MEKKPESLADNLNSPRRYTPMQPPMNGGTAPAPIDYPALAKRLDGFKKKLLKKFSFVTSLVILPANAAVMFEEDEQVPKEVYETKPIHLMMIMPEEQYKNLQTIKKDVVALVKESGENLWVHIKTSEVDLWNYGLDSKYEFIDAIAAGFPLHDTGFLGALRVASIHKNLVLNWLNVGRIRYVATYAIGGSLVRGTADETSDVDTFVIIDDTDVKRMSRVELLEKLRGRIVYEYVKEATALAGVKNILNVQVYLLTDFWQSVKDAQPVMFTFIRDGIPLYDRGTFTPWKRLLQMGRIKPSPEAIDLYMKEGDRTEELINRRLMDSMVDAYFGVVTPTQAMMMLAGHAPPVPKVIVEEVKKVLVEQEKVLTMKDLKTLERVVKMYKDYEHGKLKSVSGKEIDELIAEGKEYAKKMKEVRSKLEKKMQEHQAEKITTEVFDLMKLIFGNKGQEALMKEFESEMVKKGKVPERMLAIAKELSKLKSAMKGKTLSQGEMQRYTRDAADLVNALTEYSQRKELVSLEKGIARIAYEGGAAELVMTNSGLFVIEQGGQLYHMKKNSLVKCTKQEFEHALKETKERVQFTLPTHDIEVLRKKYGEFSVSF